MNIAIGIDEFSIENVFFQDPVKNTVMEDSNFIRALYSTDLFVLNGIFLKITLKHLLINVKLIYGKNLIDLLVITSIYQLI